MKITKIIYNYLKTKYNLDELLNFYIILYVILIILNIFLKSYIINYLELIIIIMIVFRIFSKNKYKRKKENAVYLKIKNTLIKPIKNIKRNYKDRHKYIYKKCRKCKTTLRLPIPFDRGIKHAKCPECGYRLTIINLRKQKIEIIK